MYMFHAYVCYFLYTHMYYACLNMYVYVLCLGIHKYMFSCFSIMKHDGWIGHICNIMQSILYS